MYDFAMQQRPEFFEVVNGRGFHRPVAHVSLDAAIEMVNDVLVYCREQGIKELFANGQGLTGFDSPTLSERFFLAEKWAAAAAGAVRLSMCVHGHMIDPEKFGMTVANNRGLVSDVFDNEPQAIAWLDRFVLHEQIRSQAAAQQPSLGSSQND